MQDIDPRVLAAIVAMMQQQGAEPPPQTSYTMPPNPTQYPAPAAAMGAGALGGAGFGAQLGGLPGAAVGAGAGGSLGLLTDFAMRQGARPKATEAYNNEFGPAQEAQALPPSDPTMPPAQGTYPDPLGAMSVGAIGGAGMGAIAGGFPLSPIGAAAGGVGGGLAGLISQYILSQTPKAKRTRA